jgi:glycosyltransferase involved in cell wall biosynthesis
MMIRVTHYERRPRVEYQSIERIFEDVRRELAPDILARVEKSRFDSNSLWRCAFNALEAIFRQGDVNHVTGDSHYLAIFLSHRKTVVTIHDCVMMSRLQGAKRFFYWLFWLWLPTKRASIVVTVSDKSQTELQGFVNIAPNKLRIIPNGISNEFTHQASEGTKRNTRNLLQIGTGPNKNLERIIAALNGLQCHLTIIGNPSESQIQLLHLHRVQYTIKAGLDRNQIVDEYRACDALLFLSTYEGFGLPILEANAVGRAVITSNIEPMLTVAGPSGFFIDPNDIEQIRAAIAKVLDNTAFRQELVVNGLKNASKYHIRNVGLAHEAIYRELALAKPR